MKIYLSEKNLTNTEFTHVTNIINLDNTVENTEAKEIVIDNFLRSFKQDEIEEALKKILSKLRIGATVTILDVDVDVISMKFSRGDMTLEELNNSLFSFSLNSLINIEFITGIISKFVEITDVSLDQNNANFIIKGKRSK
jgi:hypothetical protein